MALLRYLPTTFSTLFRLAIFIFLRVIPTPLGKVVLPALYSTYLVSLWLSSPEKIINTQSNKRVKPQISRARENSLLTIIFSLPSPSWRLRMSNIAVNTLLLLAAVEFVAYPFLDPASDVIFTRVGAVYPDSVKIVVRYPQQKETGDSYRVVWREAKSATTAESDAWRDGPLIHLKEEEDWIDTIRLEGLWPSTAYEYSLSASNRTLLSYPPSPIQFRTFPDPRLPTGSHFRFVATSCATPNFPYVPLQGNTIKGFDLLARYLFPRNTPKDVAIQGYAATQSHPASSLPPAEFLLFLGDFIYADVPIYIGDEKEAYRRLYRRNYQSKSFRNIYERLPIFHAYDDHEIINNFAGQGNDSTPPFPNASDAFKIYNANANYDSPDNGQHYYYDFRYGDVAFFVMDTRRYRSNVGSGDSIIPTMLGDKQLAALHDWLGKVNSTATFKFIATSVPFTSLWGHDAITDSWAGFSSEKTALLNTLHSVPNLILLSGDRHEFAAIEFNNKNGHKIREFSTSPLSMFYIPFIRTLRMRSGDGIQGEHTQDTLTGVEEGKSTRTEEVPQERVLKYIASGNYKWSTFEIDTRDLEKPTLRLEVMVDGSSAYHFEMIGSPVKLYSATALGAFVPTGFREMLDRIGIKPNKWF